MKESQAACRQPIKDLLNCLLESECYKVENKTPRECLQRGDQMPEECKQLNLNVYQCKRSQLDTRTRFRGKRDEAPIS
ncbi:Dephospho-CoA kinase (Dephosphocoenzyme A kinase) (COAE) [Mactra antiquata]